ncbi:BAH domain [Striga asiatica]|uniref:BAH domain n=1 Tax=Striga asiatica TaxID=4170 RepID=A0A5A7PBV1_STRAF|nr:BAH domain [Striga asiatica]
MKVNLFAWLTVLLCLLNFLSTSFGHENSDINREKQLSTTQNELPIHPGTLTGENLNLPTDSYGRRKLTESEIITPTKNAQGGKGSYGGANVGHRTSSHKNASFSIKHDFFSLFVIRSFCFFLLLACRL